MVLRFSFLISASFVGVVAAVVRHVILVGTLSSCNTNHVEGFTIASGQQRGPARRQPLFSSASSSGGTPQSPTEEQGKAGGVAGPPAPVLNGKRVLPFKVLAGGLKGHDGVAAVYAVLNSEYERGSEGWDAVEYVGVSRDLGRQLQIHAEEHGGSKVAHVRALSFAFPQPDAMRDVAHQWRVEAIRAGAEMLGTWTADSMDHLFNDDDEDDDDDDDDFLEMTADAMASVAASSDGSQQSTIVSPFDQSSTNNAAAEVVVAAAAKSGEGGALPFTAANVDKVLDEVRPYLIADGGNVIVARVDEEEKNVYLQLEGACGSCASSTVTMQMGIERVLKENFADLGRVLQVEDDPESKPTELTLEAVEEEVGRLTPAIIAMGGGVQLIAVNDPEPGVVKIYFEGSQKVQQGVELAILDVPLVTRVDFI